MGRYGTPSIEDYLTNLKDKLDNMVELTGLVKCTRKPRKSQRNGSLKSQERDNTMKVILLWFGTLDDSDRSSLQWTISYQTESFASNVQAGHIVQLQNSSVNDGVRKSEISVTWKSSAYLKILYCSLSFSLGMCSYDHYRAKELANTGIRLTEQSVTVRFYCTWKRGNNSHINLMKAWNTPTYKALVVFVIQKKRIGGR